MVKGILPGLMALGLLCGGCSGDPTAWRHASDVVGDDTRVCGPISSVVYDDGNVFVNVGRDYPDPERLTLVFFGGGPPYLMDLQEELEGEDVCATGQVSEYEGVAQMVDPELSFPEIETDYAP